MTILVGYRVTPSAILEASHPKDLQCFIEAKIQLSPDVLDKDVLMDQLRTGVQARFGSHFSVSLIDSESELPFEEGDETALILVDARTYCVNVH